MARKQGRQTPELNLQPELPQVVSRDFNLFYTPEKAPLPQGVEDFAKSLDRFVNQGLTESAIAGEIQEKKINSATAEKDFNELKLTYRDAIKEGKIDKTANPYYLEKYKELSLNDYATQFTAVLNKAYEDQKVVDDIRPNGFTNFYKNELGKFIKKNELAGFDALDLEKGFFKETSKYRNQLENNHNQKQLEVFKTKFNERVVARIGAIINQFKDLEKNDFAESGASYNKFNLMGDSINALIAELIDVNGDGRETIDVVMEGIKNWANSTSDYELAKQIVLELPEKLLGGTNSIENIGRIRLERDKLFDVLVAKSAERTGKFNQLTKGLRERDQLNTYSFLVEQVKKNPDFDVVAWSNDPKRTGSEKQGATDYLKDQLFDRGASDNQAVLRELDVKIQRGDADVYQYIRDETNKGNLRPETRNKYLSEYIPNTLSGKYSEALNNDLIRGYIFRLDKIISNEKGGDSSLEAQEAKTILSRKLLAWYKDNGKNYKNQSSLDDALEAYFIKVYEDLKKTGNYSSLFGKFEDTLSKTQTSQGRNIVENFDLKVKQKEEEAERQKEEQRLKNANVRDNEAQQIYDRQYRPKYYSSQKEADKAKQKQLRETQTGRQNTQQRENNSTETGRQNIK